MKTVKLVWHYEGTDVKISGTWNNGIPKSMTKQGDKWIYLVDLEDGIYEYKFFVDNKVYYSSRQPNITNKMGQIHNIIVVDNKQYKSNSLISINNSNLMLKEIVTYNTDVKIVSILGSARMGKSTLFNTILSKYTNYNNNVFATSKSFVHCTHGIDYVYVPDMQVIFCDIQGLNSENSANDPKLLLFAYLMSDIIIFTEQKMLNKTTLQSLSPLSSFLTYLNQEDIDKRDVKPSLVFRISDFTLSGTPQENLDQLLTEHEDQSKNIVINMKKLFRDIKAYHTNPLDRSELKMLESGNFYGLLDNEENGFDDFINEINNYLAGIPPRIKFSEWHNNLKHYVKQINENKKIDFNKLDIYQSLTKIELLEYSMEIKKRYPELFTPLFVNHTQADNKKIQARIKLTVEIKKEFNIKFGVVNENLKNEIYEKLMTEIFEHMYKAIEQNSSSAYNLLTEFIGQTIIKGDRMECNIDIEDNKMIEIEDLKHIERFIINKDLTDKVVELYYKWRLNIVKDYTDFKKEINDKQHQEIIKYNDLITTYVKELPNKIKQIVLQKKYDIASARKFLLQSYEVYLDEIIKGLVSEMEKIAVLQYSIKYSIDFNGKLVIDLSSYTVKSSNNYKYINSIYFKAVQEVNNLRKSYDIYKYYKSKKLQILGNPEIYQHLLLQHEDIAIINEDVCEFYKSTKHNAIYYPMFYLKKQYNLKQVVKKLVKDKILFKKKYDIYLHGVKYSSNLELYKVIIDNCNTRGRYQPNAFGYQPLQRYIDNTIDEIQFKKDNNKSYQRFLNLQIKKAQELKAKYEIKRANKVAKPSIQIEALKEIILELEVKENKPKVMNEKYKKKSIPKSLKKLCWDIHVGGHVGTTKCLCCKHQEIRQIEFHCGHVVSEKNGGEMTIDNLRPICAQCNLSMGMKNMNEFMRCFEKNEI